MIHVIVLTLNAAGDWPQLASSLSACIDPRQVLIVDSNSSDGTRDLAAASGFQVKTIERSAFDHGGTRQMAAEMLPAADILVYLTQDAVLSSPDAISRLVAAFDDPQVAIAYGRQLPRRGAGAIEAHARLFNYPGQSRTRELEDRDRYGLKTIFVSNSFAAYRRSTLVEVGGFPAGTIFGEDTITAAKCLLAGYKVAYVAEAAVYHSHAHTYAQEFRRSFDIGVLHGREGWLLEQFGGAGGEGARFVRSELSYLAREDAARIPEAILRTALKYVGYRCGRSEKRFTPGMKRRMSMHGGYWTKPH